MRVAADNEAELRTELARALELGKGVVHVLAPLEALEQAMAKKNPSLARMGARRHSICRFAPPLFRSPCGRRENFALA